MPGLYQSPTWKVLSPQPNTEAELIATYGLGKLAARVMAARGHRVSEETAHFLQPSLKDDWADPSTLPGLIAVADGLEAAMRKNKRIAVFGDFDVDGMSSTCLLVQALRDLGCEAQAFIPNRFTEGYGLSQAALTRLIDLADPEVIVTVDNGIAAAAEVEWLHEQGIEVFVTDHHEPGDLVPGGIPVADPKLTQDNPSRELAGAGVALKLVQELGKRFGQPELWLNYTDIASLGTISDMMVLQGENRALVHEGLIRMRKSKRPGLLRLAEAASVSLAEITADSLPFSLIPRLNAAGRMGLTDVAFDLLFTDDDARAQELAERLEHINTERREIELELAEEAFAMVDNKMEHGRIIVVASEGWHEGVKGIVASRLVQRYGLPAIVFSISDGIARGSGRSIGEVNLFKAVESCQDLLVRFGGHAGAVGVTIEAANLDAFIAQMEEYLADVDDHDFISIGEVAAPVSLDEINFSELQGLEALQPFGQGNKKPLFASCGVSLRSRSAVGAKKDHLRCVVTDGISSIPAIMFRAPQITDALYYDGAVDIVFEPIIEVWQGRKKLKLMIRDILYRTPHIAPYPPFGRLDLENFEFIDNLFDHAARILTPEEYQSIIGASTFATRIAARQQGSLSSPLQINEKLLLKREYNNPVDEYAIRFERSNGEAAGYVRARIAAALAPHMDEGFEYGARVAKINEQAYLSSVDVVVERLGHRNSDPQHRFDRAATFHDHLQALSPDQQDQALQYVFLGPDTELHPAQSKTLEALNEGKNCLCVMATGRGKSFIFHMHAARLALRKHKASVLVYPLRALVNDQSYHLVDTLSRLGVRARVLTGETSLADRNDIFELLYSGTLDVVLTTPEFLSIHRGRFSQSQRIGFVVFDEAHHISFDAHQTRQAYAEVPAIIQELGKPVVLALTATAPDEAAECICQACAIAPENVICDTATRDNLSIVDMRGAYDRDLALVRSVASGEKCIVYVNSREKSVALARELRQAIPDLAPKIAFYNAGLGRRDRRLVEDYFREGKLSCICATSAFGEGVNIPDVRRVIMYHMPLGSVSFNQIAGRAGRDGGSAEVQLLFGGRDARVNERLLMTAAPSRNVLIALYRALMQEGSTQLDNTGLRELVMDKFGLELSEAEVSCGVRVFAELELLNISGYGTKRWIHMADNPSRVELDQSVCYVEGCKGIETFSRFSSWVLSSSSDELLSYINRPIVPRRFLSV